ncbi:MAG: glycosyltransferase [Planctomycetota bacterium]
MTNTSSGSSYSVAKRRSDDPKISVVICTWNRAAMLERALKSLSEMDAEATDWELIIVDNNCTDETSHLLSTFAERLPLQVVNEPRPGLAVARNRGLQAASGDWVILTDDDVRVSRNWISAYANAFEKWPEAAYFGGPITPEFESTPPPWVEQCGPLVDGLLVKLDFGPSERILEHSELPWGPSMAVKASVLKRHGFDERFGLVGSEAVRGEETFVLRAIRDEGHQGVWVPGAAVDHWIPNSRLTEESVQEYYHGAGRAIVRGYDFNNQKLGFKYRLAAQFGPVVGNTLSWIGELLTRQPAMRTRIRTAVCEGIRDELAAMNQKASH